MTGLICRSISCADTQAHVAGNQKVLAINGARTMGEMSRFV
jgi:hypothetical protein